jgi:ABC-type Fe3+ transport system permease subunit
MGGNFCCFLLFSSSTPFSLLPTSSSLQQQHRREELCFTLGLRRWSRLYYTAARLPAEPSADGTYIIFHLSQRMKLLIVPAGIPN